MKAKQRNFRETGGRQRYIHPYWGEGVLSKYTSCVEKRGERENKHFLIFRDARGYRRKDKEDNDEDERDDSDDDDDDDDDDDGER